MVGFSREILEYLTIAMRMNGTEERDRVSKEARKRSEGVGGGKDAKFVIPTLYMYIKHLHKRTLSPQLCYHGITIV